MSGFVTVQSALLDLPPRYLASSRASAIFAALEGADPSLTFESMARASEQCKLIVVFIGSDLCAAGQRAKMEYMKRIQDQNQLALDNGNGMLVLVDGHCVAHVLHREVEHIVSSKDLICRMFNVAVSIGLPGMAAQIKLALSRVIREDSES